MAARKQGFHRFDSLEPQTPVIQDIPTNILYELNICTEWHQDVEALKKPTKQTGSYGLVGKLYSYTHRSISTFLRSAGIPSKNASPCHLPQSLVKLINAHVSWKICLSPDAEFLAVLQDNYIELRTGDWYNNLLGRRKLSDDPYPQWRRMAWSADGSILAVSSSSGAVTLLDALGGEFFTIEQAEAQTAADLSSATAAIIFLETNKGTDSKWSNKLLIINHHGSLSSYLVSADDYEYELEHTFLFSNMFPRGISSAVYSEKHALLIVTGLPNPCTEELNTQAGLDGITMWRVLSGIPYYKLVTDYDDVSSGASAPGFLKKMKSAIHGAIYGDGTQELIYKACLSPDGKHLLALSTESCLTLYQVPSLKVVNKWQLDTQPDYDKLNPEIEESTKKKKYIKENPLYNHLLDVEWWSNEAIILARYSGSVLVADVEKMTNLLGDYPEWFESCPQVQQAHSSGFLTLECEAKVLSGSRKRTASEGQSAEGEDNSGSEDDEVDKLTYIRRSMSKAMYYITDMDKFEPPKKKTKHVKKTYRLVSLKSTTPEELYARKIDNEEYGEAIQLAKRYRLDTDLVYQRQWRKSPASTAAINDYLGKIKKRSWVLQEVLDRVPTHIDAMRELLEYGLRGTDLETMVRINQGKDNGKFIASKPIELDDDDDTSGMEDEFGDHVKERLAAKRQKHREELLSQIDFENLTIEQKELCRVRLTILSYLDRLSTYEEILGGGRAAERGYDEKFFRKFRSQSSVEAITDYARLGDWKAVDIMFIYLGDRTLPHRLAILSNFPETQPPGEYKEILPEIEKSGELVIYHEESLRAPDWCELPQYRKAYDNRNPHEADFLYENSADLMVFRDQLLTPQILTEWYKMRACDIESRSRLVDHSLMLVQIGMELNVQGLDDLRDDLVDMEMIVYDCNYGDGLLLEELRAMDDLARLKLIMSKSPPEKHASHIQKWMKPFLDRCESHEFGSYDKLISQFLMDTAVHDLQLVFKIFECSRKDQPAEERILKTEAHLLRSAIDCIYACERDDQLSYVLSILECLPQRKSGDMERVLVKLHNEVDEMEQLIRLKVSDSSLQTDQTQEACTFSAAEILEGYEINMTIHSIRDSLNDVEAATLLMKKLARRANNSNPKFSTSQWTQLQSDMSELQSKVFRCINKNTCLEIFVESLLCSGILDNIQLALAYLEGDMESSTHSMSSSVGSLGDVQIAYDHSVDLIVSAAREYFNASGSYEDQNMRLAEACLHLLSKTHDNIKEELDLIASLPLLQDFNVFMLPLHVRLCQDKMTLVEEALKSSTTAYKQYPKILKLASFLRVDENAAFKLVIHYALSQGDTKFGYKHCKSLMEKRYPEIWTECHQLASNTTITRADDRLDLLSYCLVHCSDDMIEPILRQRMALKNEILMSRMGSQQKRSSPAAVTQPASTPASAPSSAPTSHKLDWKSLFSSKTAKSAVGALAESTKTTRSLLSNLGEKWLDQTVSLISSGLGASDKQEQREEFSYQGCHPFYEGLIHDSVPSVELSGPNSSKMSLAEDILRTMKLEEMLTKKISSDIDYSEVLTQCAQNHLASDLSLGLGYMLALPKPVDADASLRELPHVPLILKLGAYYYALQLSASFSLPLHANVTDVIAQAQSLTSKELAKHGCQDLYNKLDLYIRLIEDHGHACYLQTLVSDIDSHRFTADNLYKRETVLNLARSLDELHYNTAIDMAKRYEIDLWDVYMTHVEYLFTECNYTSAQIEKRIARLAIIDELLKHQEKFSVYMSTHIRPSIPGTDMGKLLLYYKLIGDSPTTEDISPETHRKLLSKLQPAAPGLDYRALIEGNVDPVDVMRPVLKSGNVYVFSKLCNKIPVGKEKYLSTSAVFNAWAQKLFEEGPTQNSKTPESTAAWLHRYESCAEFLSKMNPEHNVSFIKHSVFSDKLIEMVPLEARLEICKRDVKFCNSNLSKEEQHSAAENEQRDELNWNEAMKIVESYRDHLEKMGQETLIALLLSDDDGIRSYHRKIDGCCGDEEKLKSVLVNMLLDGQSLEMVDDILEVFPLQDWTARNALIEAASIICKHLREKKNILPNQIITMDAFTTLIKLVSDHQKEGGELVNSEDVMSLFRPLIPDSDIQVRTKLECLSLLKQHFHLNEEDQLSVLLYETEAITLNHWPNREISIEDLKSAEKRSKLCQALLTESTGLQQFLTLPSLLSVWPPFKDSSSLWLALIDRLLDVVNSRQAAENVVAICLSEELSSGVVQQAYSKLRSADYLHQAAVLALQSNSPVLLEDVVSLISDRAEEFSSDTSLLKAVFENELIVNFIGTEIFQPLVEFLAAHQRQADYLDPSAVINQLVQAGHMNEAKQVEKACRGQHGMRTLDAAAGAISAISRWWRKE